MLNSSSSSSSGGIGNDDSPNKLAASLNAAAKLYLFDGDESDLGVMAERAETLELTDEAARDTLAE